MLNDISYETIRRRKSFHSFPRLERPVTQKELAELNAFLLSVEQLTPSCIVKTHVELNSSAGAEYSVSFYADKSDLAPVAVGYVGEQVELYLTSRNLGTLWYGSGYPDLSSVDGLDFHCMILFGKVAPSTFLSKMAFSAQRYPLPKVWKGDTKPYSKDVFLGPSSMNSQPARVENTGYSLLVSASGRSGRFGLVSQDAVTYYHRMDMGIFLTVLEFCLDHNGEQYQRKLLQTEGTILSDEPIASYTFL